jgi:AcrR family transcriptional regulator
VAIPTRRPPAGAAVLRDDITTAIRAAVMQELADNGYGRLSIEAVARRAGVGKTAVYRRWSNKLEMVLEIVSAVAARQVALPDTGSLRGDLDILLRVVAHALQHRLASQIIPDLLAEAARTPKIAETLHRTLRAYQHELGTHLVGRAVARGELPAATDPEAAVDLFLGPIYWRLAVTRQPVDETYLAGLTETIVAALTAPATAEL